jgi:(2R)-3-sulfolactate dehydrogenase (NADP+)
LRLTAPSEQKAVSMTDPVQTLSLAEAERLILDTLARCNTGPTQAASVARALIGAELAGQGGHGLRRLPAYGAQASSGKVDGHAVATARTLRPGALAIDAGHGFAYPALDLAVAELPAMARAQGIAMAGVCRSHHAGVTGLVVEALARQGLAALMLVNAPASIAPWGGARPLFGTNPVAFAVPLPGAEPIVIDLSVSRVARGRIMAAAQTGSPIPEGWALAPDGTPTTDAKAGLAGTMIPMGEAKGAALALMVELLAAGLTGANYGFETSSFFTADGPPPGSGQFLMAIDPAAFGADGLTRFAVMAAAIEGDADARLPGRRRQEVARRVAAEGIAVDAGLLDDIARTGAATV